MKDLVKTRVDKEGTFLEEQKGVTLIMLSPGLLDYKINGFQKNRIIIEWCTKGKGKVNRCTIHWEACYRKIKESPWKIECFLED